MAMTLPWARAASFCSRTRSWMISSEFGPRSTVSPVWIRTTSPPVQWPLLSTTLAERRISRQAEKSPCRSPTATMRCKGAAVAGMARARTVASQARRNQRPRKWAPFLVPLSSGECCPTSGCRASIADDDHGVTGMLKIMIIRHAEKHQHGSRDRGVTEDGRPAHHELTVRGWQRAGALVHLFAPPGGLPAGSRIHTPRSIFASDATGDSPSLRAMHTAGPLAAALGIPVNHAYAEEEEAALAAVVIAAPSPALIVWHHAAIPRLVMEIAGKLPGCPVHWPDDRFDLIWILERNAPRAGWSFSQVSQRLLPGDGTDVAPP